MISETKSPGGMEISERRKNREQRERNKERERERGEGDLLTVMTTEARIRGAEYLWEG